MSRSIALSSLVAPFLVALLVALLVAVLLVAGLPGVACAQTSVRIVGRDPQERHVISRVVGSVSVPYRRRTQTYSDSVTYEFGHMNVPVYGPVCVAPCTAVVPAGPVTFGVDGIVTHQTFAPPAGSTLIVESDRRDLEHALGWTIDLGGLVVGALMSFNILAQGDLGQLDLSRKPPDLFDDEWEIASWIAAGSTVLLTQVVGLMLIGLSPTAHIEIAPGGLRF